MSEVQNVVIVGGGAAGITLAASLAPKLNAATHQLVLVSERPFTTHMPGKHSASRFLDNLPLLSAFVANAGAAAHRAMIARALQTAPI